MIKNIKFKFGSSPTSTPLELNLTPITIFVGPNNSGKSKILSEIHGASTNPENYIANVILEKIEFNSILDIDTEIEKLTLRKKDDVIYPAGTILYGKQGNIHTLDRQGLHSILSKPHSHSRQFLSYYVALHTLTLGGASRISLISTKDIGDLKDSPKNPLAALFQNDTKRAEVRKIIHEAFKKYFVIDPTVSGKLNIRLSDIPPKSDNHERRLDDEAIAFFSNAKTIESASDGVKAYTGIITSIVAGDPKSILIDEPEAFLHPSLAFKLGKEVSKTAMDNSKNIFISTHSSNFLMGCIQSGVPVNIIRLTYTNEVPTARLLPSDKILKLMRHPLLRSTGVLNGLFYENVIVMEADSDRAFYQEINERLLTYDPDRGIPNCLFINAQNKQTIHEIMKPLRELGIPCAAIVDVDVIKEGGVVWGDLSKSAFIPEFTMKGHMDTRANINKKFIEKDKDFKKHGGVNVLDPDDKESCNNLFDELDSYGIFTVRNGELESWLKSLGARKPKSPDWLIEIFELLGEEPSLENYIKPTKGDVWDFIGDIKKWFNNTKRKGIPD